MKMDYEHYKLTILEWARYLGESVLICVVIDALCYQSLITFLFMLPIPFWYIRQRKRQLLMLRRRRLHHQFRDALNALGAGISAGYSLENAVLEAGKDMNRIYGPDREISREMAYMAAQMRVSVPVEKLFYDLGSRSQVEDIRSFSEILAQSKRMGGNMRETIQNCVSIMEASVKFYSD